MSFEGILANQVLKGNSDNVLLDAVLELTRNIKTQNELTARPIVLLRSSANNLSSNVADGELILSSPPTPANTYIVIADWNVNFTTVAGVVRVVVLDASNNIKNNVLLDVNSSTNGTGGAVLEPGDRLAILGSTAGAGVFGCYFSGTKQIVRNT